MAWSPAVGACGRRTRCVAHRLLPVATPAASPTLFAFDGSVPCRYIAGALYDQFVDHVDCGLVRAEWEEAK